MSTLRSIADRFGFGTPKIGLAAVFLVLLLSVAVVTTGCGAEGRAAPNGAAAADDQGSRAGRRGPATQRDHGATTGRVALACQGDDCAQLRARKQRRRLRARAR